MERLRDVDYGAPDSQAGRSLQSIHTAPHVRMGSAPGPQSMVRCPSLCWPTSWRGLSGFAPTQHVRELHGLCKPQRWHDWSIEPRLQVSRRSIWGHDLVLWP